MLNADIMLNLHKTFRIEHLYLFVRNSAKVLQQAMDGQVSMTLGKVFVVGNAIFVFVARHNSNKLTSSSSFAPRQYSSKLDIALGLSSVWFLRSLNETLVLMTSTGHQ